MAAPPTSFLVPVASEVEGGWDNEDDVGAVEAVEEEDAEEAAAVTEAGGRAVGDAMASRATVLRQRMVERVGE